MPKLAGSLISVLQLQDKGLTVRTTDISSGGELLIEWGNTIVGVARRYGKAYMLNTTIKEEDIVDTSLKATINNTESKL